MIFSKKLPETDEERIIAIQSALNQEELNEYGILSQEEIQNLDTFLISFEGAKFVYNQAIEDENKAKAQYIEFFKNAQLYISHFIQVLQFTAIRNEIKAENLALYGFKEGREMVLPGLSTEETVMLWGENIIRGEMERISRGGVPLYNPAIAKVKVHYELFKETTQSLKIYKQNVLRLHNSLHDMQKKADDWLIDIWTRLEERIQSLSPEEQSTLFKVYKIQSLHRRGEQLSVFD
jgi:hypothetical protein